MAFFIQNTLGEILSGFLQCSTSGSLLMRSLRMFTMPFVANLKIGMSRATTISSDTLG